MPVSSRYCDSYCCYFVAAFVAVGTYLLAGAY